MPEARIRPRDPIPAFALAPSARAEPVEVRVTRFVAANGPVRPGRDLLSVGIALAPEGETRLRDWAQRALSAAARAGFLERDGAWRITGTGARMLRRVARRALSPAREDAADLGPDTARAREGKEPRIAEGAKAGARTQLRRVPPWERLHERGVLTAEQARAADALDAAAEGCEATGGVAIRDVCVDSSPDFERGRVAQLDRVFRLVRLTAGVTGAEWDAVEWVVLRRMEVSRAVRGGVRLGDSAARRAAFVAELRRGLDRIALNAG